MDTVDLIDQLVDRIEQLKEIMQIKTGGFNVDALLLQSIADHADGATLTAIIEDIERFIFKLDEESGNDY